MRCLFLCNAKLMYLTAKYRLGGFDVLLNWFDKRIKGRVHNIGRLVLPVLHRCRVRSAYDSTCLLGYII